MELRLFDMAPEALYRASSAHPSPRDITMGVLLFIACCMTFAEQKQRPTTSLRLNVSTSTTRKLTPSPAVVMVCCVSQSLCGRNILVVTQYHDSTMMRLSRKPTEARLYRS